MPARLDSLITTARSAEALLAESQVAAKLGQEVAELLPGRAKSAVETTTKLLSDLPLATFTSIRTEGRILHQTNLGKMPIVGEFRIDEPTLKTLDTTFHGFTSRLKTAHNDDGLHAAHDAFDAEFIPALHNAGVQVRLTSKGALGPRFLLPLQSSFALKSGATVDLNTTEGMRALMQQEKSSGLGDTLAYLFKDDRDWAQGRLSPKLINDVYANAFVARPSAEELSMLDPGIVAAHKAGQIPTVPMHFEMTVPDRTDAAFNPNALATVSQVRLEEGIHLFQTMNGGYLTSVGSKLTRQLRESPQLVKDFRSGEYLDADHYVKENEVPVVARALGLRLNGPINESYSRSSYRFEKS